MFSPMIMSLLLLTTVCTALFAQEVPHEGTRITECKAMLGEFRGRLVTPENLMRALERNDRVRPIYRSAEPDKNLIVIISNDRDVRLDVAEEIARRLALPAFVVGSSVGERQRFQFAPTLEIVRPPRFNSIEALAIVESLGLVPATYWASGDTFLTYLNRQKQRRDTLRHDMVANIALMQNHFGLGHWNAQPLRTFFDNIERESNGRGLGGAAVRRLAAVFLIDESEPQPRHSLSTEAEASAGPAWALLDRDFASR